MQTNDTLKTIHTRRSCRAYQDRQLDRDSLDTVIDAGLWAASGRGSQDPVIVAVQDKALRDELSRMNASIMGTDSDPFYGAPTVLVVLARRDVHTSLENGSLVIGNMMLAAESIGLASCWIHRAKEMFDSPRGKELLGQWGLDPEVYYGVGNCILGYAAPDGTRPAADRKEGRVLYL